jgi:putative membrane-bound dehydrogenase-like protein
MIRSLETLLGAFVFVFCIAGPSLGQEPKDSIDRDYSQELPRIPPLEPKDALASFQIHAGFHMQLVAAEPLLFDPVAMAFDESGRLFVVEMRGYSERREDLIGAVRLLEDHDGDGVFDTSSVYADKLAWPTAVACYDGGIFVGTPPDILYMKDTDGDGRADRREVIFSGFGLDNVQGLLNSFNWGLDNVIHGATSGSGARVVSAAFPLEAPLTLRGRDFAIEPRTRHIEATSGGAQHGLTFDDWGHEFICHNSDNIIQVMFEDRYAARNPLYSPDSPRLSIASDGPQADVFRISPVEPWRIVRTRLRVKGIVEGPIEGGGKAAGYFTSATGVTIYRGDAWPKEFRGNAFIGDVGSNLVHRKTLRPDGVAFRADRADPGVEFLASKDNWFRPVQFCNGPDGCLYVVDMYREVIEHPDSLPPVIKKHLDLNSGFDRGRIYRIVPDGFRQPKIPALGDASSNELVALLGHANAWHAETAQRLLYERADPAAVAALEALARDGSAATGRMRAMYALRSLGALSESTLRHGLKDANGNLRRHSVRLAESFPKPSDELLDELAQLAGDPDAGVRHQLAFTIGTWDRPQRPDTLTRLARSDGADRWMILALLSSLSSGAGVVAEALLADEAFVARAQSAPLLRALGEQVGASGDPADAARVLRALDALPQARGQVRLALIESMLSGARDAGSSARLRPVLEQSPAARAAMEHMVARALDRAADASLPARARAEAIQTLAFAPLERALPILSETIRAAGDSVLRRAAISTLAQFSEPAAAEVLISNLGGAPPALVTPMLDAVFSRDAWVRQLLSAFSSGALDYALLPSTFRHRLQRHTDDSIRAAAARLDAQHAPQDIQAVLASLGSVEKLRGIAEKGGDIFGERCAACHRVRGVGESVGPDLAGVRDWDTARLLTSIVHPNAEINPQYTAYSVETLDGRSLSGVLDAETATSITLRMSGGAQTVLKNQVRTAKPMDISLMPEGLNEGLAPQGVADLIAFIRAE